MGEKTDSGPESVYLLMAEVSHLFVSQSQHPGTFSRHGLVHFIIAGRALGELRKGKKKGPNDASFIRVIIHHHPFTVCETLRSGIQEQQQPDRSAH